MDGVRGFEPLNDWTKTSCLTAWRYPNVFTNCNYIDFNAICQGFFKKICKFILFFKVALLKFKNKQNTFIVYKNLTIAFKTHAKIYMGLSSFMPKALLRSYLCVLLQRSLRSHLLPFSSQRLNFYQPFQLCFLSSLLAHHRLAELADML